MQTLDPAVADVTVAVSVLPGLKAEFDAVKVARLIKHINTIVSTMQEAIDPSDTVPPTLGVPLSLSPTPSPRSHLIIPYLLPLDTINDISATKDRSLVTAAVLRDSLDPDRLISIIQAISPIHCYIDVTVELPLISIELVVSDFHSVTFYINGLETHVLVRQNDIQVYFALKSLKLLDSLRGEEQKAIIFTPPLTLVQRQQHRRYIQRQQMKQHGHEGMDISKINNDHNDEYESDENENENEASNAIHSFDKVNHNSNSLFNIRYSYMYNRQSPLFISHGQELKIEFTSLGLSIDEDSVLRLKPFLEMLSKEMAVGPGTGIGSGIGLASVSLSSTNVVPTTVSREPVKVAAIGPIGMLITVSIGSVSLSLMRSRREKINNYDNSNDNNNNNKNSHNSSKSGRLNSKLFSRIISTDDRIKLEEAYSIVITDMFAAVDMRQATAADVRLRSFIVLDCRPVSEKYVYREMLCRSTLGSEHNSVAYSSIDRNKRVDIPVQMKTTTHEEDSNILTIIYTEESKESSTIEIELRNITSFISVDSMIEFVDVVMCNVASVLAVATALTNKQNNIQIIDNDIDYIVTAVEDDVGRLNTVRREAMIFDKRATATKDDSPFSWLNNNSTNSEITTSITTPTPTSPSLHTGSGTWTNANANTLGVGYPEPSGRSRRLQSSVGNGNSKQLKANGQLQSTIDSPQISHASVYGLKKKETSPVASLINVIVSVVSPRLLLLEDPESADSRAIVIRSGASVHYCNNSKQGALTAETIHVSLQTLEIFALTGLTKGRPQQIGER